jgi:hypothetical protein
MFPQHASERLCVGGSGACPEPVERVSRTLRSTTSDLRPLTPSLPIKDGRQCCHAKCVIANAFGALAASFGPDFRHTSSWVQGQTWEHWRGFSVEVVAQGNDA